VPAVVSAVVRPPAGVALPPIAGLIRSNRLAWCLAFIPDAQTHDPRRAVEPSDRAVKLAPEEGTYWRTLAVGPRCGEHRRAPVAGFTVATGHFRRCHRSRCGCPRRILCGFAGDQSSGSVRLFHAR
jgi:hypothetical protein